MHFSGCVVAILHLFIVILSHVLQGFCALHVVELYFMRFLYLQVPSAFARVALEVLWGCRDLFRPLWSLAHAC